MPSNETKSELTRSGEAQPSDAIASEPPPESQKSSSVFDFLYHDVRRVGSFLAQFETYGLLQQVKATETVGQSATSKTGLSGRFKVPLVAEGQAALDSTTTDDERDTAERSFDPLWTNARTLLNYLEEHSMVRRSLDDANIGQFVLVSGTLVILDVTMLKGAWENPTIMKKLREHDPEIEGLNRHQRRAQNRDRKQTSNVSDLEMLVAMLTMMPHALQARLLGEGANVWCSLDEQSVVGRASDLVLKHGTWVQGDWNMLGILDAYPNFGEPEFEGGRTIADVMADVAGTAIGQLSVTLGPIARGMLGRPPHAYGMTPLLIFREVSG